jgi:hypothetical protein
MYKIIVIIISIIINGSIVPVRILTDFVILLRHMVEPLWTRDQPVSKTSTYKHRKSGTRVHILSGIQTHDLGFQAIRTFFASYRAATGTYMTR